MPGPSEADGGEAIHDLNLDDQAQSCCYGTLGAAMVRTPVPVTLWPSGFVTVTSWGPTSAAVVLRLRVICVGLVNVTALTTTPPAMAE